MARVKIKTRKKKIRVEDYVLNPISDILLADISKTLAKQIDKETFNNATRYKKRRDVIASDYKKYARVADILKLVGVGVFVAGSLIMPNLPLALKPFIRNSKDYEVWKRFNIPYLKRTFNRLEKQKLVEITEENNLQVVKITEAGKRRILKFAIDELAVEKPKIWDGRWTLVSYDMPSKLKNERKIFLEYLKAWGFYPLHESVFLHAYPCEKQIDFLRVYLGIGQYIKIFTVSKIENDKPFREFFGVS